MSSPKYATRCVELFLEYVKIDAQSNEDSESFPSTPGQLVLLQRLYDELKTLGLVDVSMDEHGYVFATVPATSAKQDVPVIGFLAHVDTSPEMSGQGVKAIFHRDYNGQDLVLPDDPAAVIPFEGNPHLACHLWVCQPPTSLPVNTIFILVMSGFRPVTCTRQSK